MRIGRRDLLKFLGGSAIGLALSPAPWKLVDDVAIWTQNWSWLPAPPRGPITTRFTACTLCPAGCPVRARCVNGHPIALAGAALQPGERGALCPLGLAAHHLPYHPARCTTPRHPASGEPDAARAVANFIAQRKESGSVETLVVLDTRPSRVTSLLYRRLAAEVPGASYVRPPCVEGSTLDAVRAMFRAPCGPLGFDLERARTLLSFGTPVMDGWSSPARIAACTSPSRGSARLRLIQAEPRQSRSALAADRWLPLRPGSEAALALGIGHVLLREGLSDRRIAGDFSGKSSYQALVATFTPEFVAQITGLPPDEIIQTARELAAGLPAIAVGDGDPGAGPLDDDARTAIAALNFLLGAVGSERCVVPRRELPLPAHLRGLPLAPEMTLAAVPDHSVGLLLLDDGGSAEALPWPLLQTKLAQHALVVAFSTHVQGLAAHAGYFLPLAAFLETIEDVPTAPDSPAASLGVAAPLIDPPAGVVDSCRFLARVADAAGIHLTTNPGARSLEDHLRAQAAAVFGTRRGWVRSPASGPPVELKQVESADKFWELLLAGSRWLDAPAEPARLPAVSLPGTDANGFARVEAAARTSSPSLPSANSSFPLVLMPAASRGATETQLGPPLFTKLYQETSLRLPAGQAAINPRSGAEFSLTDGGRAVIQTECGDASVQMRFDAALPPGVIEMSPAPSTFHAAEHTRRVLDLCPPSAGASWRLIPARVRKA